jgi:uncharacterized protein YcfJ
METTQAPKRIHPLIAGAAASVMLVCLAGTAAITGILPSSHGTDAPAAAALATPLPVADSKATQAPPAAAVQATATTPAVEYEAPRRTVHHARVARHPVVAQAQAAEYTPPPPAPAPVYQQPAPAAHNSAVGIGVGAVVGGLLGSQIGGGNGRTLATIAGAVGGGYVGNEIAKRNP